MGDVSPINEAELVAYMKRCRELEDAGEKQTYTIGPFAALVMIGTLQLATRHPGMDDVQRELVDQIVEGFRPWFAGTLGEQIIDHGANPAFDQ